MRFAPVGFEPANLPSSATAIEEAFRQWLEPKVAGQDVIRQALRREMLYKPGQNIAKHGARKRTTHNTYLKSNVIMTLKSKEQLELERTLKAASEAASSSSGV